MKVTSYFSAMKVYGRSAARLWRREVAWPQLLLLTKNCHLRKARCSPYLRDARVKQLVTRRQLTNDDCFSCLKHKYTCTKKKQEKENNTCGQGSFACKTAHRLPITLRAMINIHLRPKRKRRNIPHQLWDFQTCKEGKRERERERERGSSFTMTRNSLFTWLEVVYSPSGWESKKEPAKRHKKWNERQKREKRKTI